MKSLPVFLALLLTGALGACAGGEGGGPDGGGDGGVRYEPKLVVAAAELAPPRGWQLLRGIVHSHSPYSHDACDDEPRIDGQRNEACFQDCRAGMCQTGQDFVFLTDHDDLFADFDYPEVLLWAEGDELVERQGMPVANRIVCPDGRRVLLMAGTESAMMPVGLEHHLGDTPAERRAAYNEVSAEAIAALQQAGALVFLQHTEGWEPEQVLELPIDGIECYNLHQNLMENLGAALQLLGTYESEPEKLPEAELLLLALFQENAADLAHWSRAVARRTLPAVLASDAHQNVFPELKLDGERLDSFRRIMHWFANYLLLEPGPYDDRAVKAALAAGRGYGAFDYLGYPRGFDFRAEADRVYELGEVVPAGQQAELVLEVPEIVGLDAAGPQPELRGLILRAGPDGSWESVAEGTDIVRYQATSGAYRAEVRMVPHHLEPWLGPEAEKYLREVVWIYSNVIYLGEPGT